MHQKIFSKGRQARNVSFYHQLEHIALGEVIESFYIEQGFNQQDFAQITGIDKRHLRRIEKGIVDIKTDTLFIIADALDISLLQLFEEMYRVKERLKKLNK